MSGTAVGSAALHTVSRAAAAAAAAAAWTVCLAAVWDRAGKWFWAATGQGWHYPQAPSPSCCRPINGRGRRGQPEPKISSLPTTPACSAAAAPSDKPHPEDGTVGRGRGRGGCVCVCVCVCACVCVCVGQLNYLQASLAPKSSGRT